jgi:malate dehydrogenase (oxaloacetate-decarboxylating)
MESEKSPDYAQLSLLAHRKYGGKVAISSKMPLETTYDLSIAYTPGVAAPCMEIAGNEELAYEYTNKGNYIAVISDGSAVLGLGNIGAPASMPVMEGKCVLFKKFADVDAVPIILDTQDTEEIIKTVKLIAGSFGGINLEDFAAPQCFEIEERLKKECNIPIFHDDQHGTAIVTLAGLINANRVTGRKMEDLSVVINGAGAAGVAIIKLLQHIGVREVIMVDTTGIIYEGREKLNPVKEAMAKITNRTMRKGTLEDAMAGSDVFIGVSAPGVLTKSMIQTMKKDPIIFAMANPVPEIMPDEAKAAGARIIATGRSDFPNQINNVLAFPGLFRGVLDSRAKNFTRSMYVAAAQAIADSVENPTEDMIIPSPFEKSVPFKVAEAVKLCFEKEGDALN